MSNIILTSREYYKYFVKSDSIIKINNFFTDLENDKTIFKYDRKTIKEIKFKIEKVKEELEEIPFLKVSKKKINRMKKKERKHLYRVLKENLQLKHLFKNNRPTKLYYQIEKVIDFLKYLFKQNVALKEIFTFGSSSSFVKNALLNESDRNDFISKSTKDIIIEYNESHNLLQLLVLSYNIIKNQSITMMLTHYLTTALKDSKKSLSQAIKLLYEELGGEYEKENLEEKLKTKDYFVFVPDNDKKIQDFLQKIDPNMPLAEKGKDILIFNRKKKTLYIGEIKLINEPGGGQNHQFNDLLKTANSSYEIDLNTISLEKLKNIYEKIYNEKIESNNKEEIITKLGFSKIQGIGILHGASIYNFSKKKEKTYMNELINNPNIYLLGEVLFYHKEIFKNNHILYQDKKVKIKSPKLLKELKKVQDKIEISKKIIFDDIKINLNKIRKKYQAYLKIVENKEIEFEKITNEEILKIKDQKILDHIFNTEREKEKFLIIQKQYFENQFDLKFKN